MIYINELIILIFVYVLLSLSSSILIEFTGLLSFLPIALFGITAFAYPLIFELIGMHFIIIPLLLVGIILLGILLGVSSYRYNTSFLAVLTFGIIASTTTIKLIPGAKLPVWIGLLIVFGITALLTLVVFHLMNTPFAVNLTLLKKDPRAVQFMGKSVYHLKFSSIVFSSFLAGIGGILFSIGYTSPLTFDPLVYGVMLIGIVVFSGQNILGTLLGVLCVAVVPELLSLTNLAVDQILALKAMIFAIVIFVFVFIKPEGLFEHGRLNIKKPKPKKITIKIKKKQTPRQKAKNIAKVKKLTRKEKKRQKQLKKISDALENKHHLKEKKLKEKQRKKLEKKLLKEKKRREKQLARRKDYSEQDRYEDHIKHQEFKSEIKHEKLLRGESLFEKGFRFAREKGDEAVKYIKKKR